AAVADYAPVHRADRKIPKDHETMLLELKRTPDILGDLGAARQSAGTGGHAMPLLIGFAAETEDLVGRARTKREKKRADIIVANDVSQPGAGFEGETNAVTIIGPDGVEPLPLQSKQAVAAAILDRVQRLLQRSTTAPAGAGQRG